MITTDTAGVTKCHGDIFKEGKDCGGTVVGMGTNTKQKTSETINERMDNNFPSD
jgi:hypothetical protein